MKVISFMNSYTQGSSGGDVLFVELTKRWKGVEHTVCTSALGEEFCKMKGLTDAHFVISTEEKEFRRVIITYALRILIGIKIALSFRSIPDIIYVSSDVLCDTFPASILKLRAKLAGKPCKWVQKFYHINNPNRKLSYITQLLSLALLRRVADIFIGCSQESVDLLKKRDFPESLLYVVKPGVTLASPDPSESSEYDAIFLGRIHPSKGIDDLFPIWQKVLKNKHEAKLVLIGKGDQKTMNFYQAKIEEHGLSKYIKMLGFLPDNDVYRLLSTTKLMIFPSHEEGYGMAVAEALANGCRVVSYDLPVIKKEFGDSVVLVPCYNLDIFAKKVIEYFECSDEEKIVPLTIRSWEQASKEEFEIILKQFAT